MTPACHKGTIDAVLVQTLTEVYEQDWVLAVDCENTDDEVECGVCGACPYYSYNNKCDCGCSDNEVHWIMAAEAPDDDAPEEEALADETPEEEALAEEAPEEEALEQDAAADARPTFLEWSGRSQPVPPEDRMAMIERIALLLSLIHI